MNDFRSFEQPQTPDVMAEFHAALGQMYATGAMDEEGPFVTNLMSKLEQGQIDPAEALKQLRVKMQSRNEYH